jgi:hypothetical protein
VGREEKKKSISRRDAETAEKDISQNLKKEFTTEARSTQRKSKSGTRGGAKSAKEEKILNSKKEFTTESTRPPEQDSCGGWTEYTEKK